MMCLNCDSEFEQTRIDKVYCSRNCKSAARKKRNANQYYVRVPAKKVKPLFSTIYAGYCEHCKKPFVSTHKSKYCSRICRTKFHGSKPENKERNRKRLFFKKGRGLIKECTCVTCGKPFKTNNKRKYCAAPCRPNYKQPWDKSQRNCIHCGHEFNPKRRDQKHCAAKCNPYRKSHSDKYYQSKEWKEIRFAFIQLSTPIDGIIISNEYCIECYRKKRMLVDMYAVDHIIPRASGGLDIHANLQSLCKSHHQSKSAAEGNSRRKGEKRLNYKRHANTRTIAPLDA